MHAMQAASIHTEPRLGRLTTAHGCQVSHAIIGLGYTKYDN